MAHSLDAAVAAGVITGEAAFCGLSPADVAQVAAFDASTKVLVRLRVGRDSRVVMTVGDFLRDVNRSRSFSDDVRDVLAVSA